MVAIWLALDDSKSRPSVARKSEVKLLRSPRMRVLGSQTSAIPVDTLLKSVSREMLNNPSTITSKKNRKNTKDRWNRMDRGFRMMVDGPALTSAAIPEFLESPRR